MIRVKRKKTGILILIFAGFLFLTIEEGTALERAEEMLFPGMYHTVKVRKENKVNKILKRIVPFFAYGESEYTCISEDGLTMELILQMQAQDEETEEIEEIETSSEISEQGNLNDKGYVVNHFYTIDSTTMIYDGELDAQKFLAKDMRIDTKKEGPKILIFHTHSQEEFADSVKGDSNTSVVGMGAYLAKRLNEKGIETIHHEGVYDLVNGKLDRSKAYELSEIGVKEILKQYPTIEVVIDLHRDGVREDLHLVTDVNGKQTAKIMFFNGLSRTKTNGDIDYLYNPYIQDNLAFSFQMQLEAEKMYPGLTRKIYLKGYRYSLHMMPKSLLIEAGAQTNTVAEMKNTMDLLANILCEVLL